MNPIDFYVLPDILHIGGKKKKTSKLHHCHRNGKINALQEDVSIGMNHAELRIGTSISIYRPLQINDLGKIQLKSRKS